MNRQDKIKFLQLASKGKLKSSDEIVQKVKLEFNQKIDLSHLTDEELETIINLCNKYYSKKLEDIDLEKMPEEEQQKILDLSRISIAVPGSNRQAPNKKYSKRITIN